jgi:recombination protein RecR
VSDLAPALERVVHELTKLPSVGRKTAQRLAFHLLQVPREEAAALARAILELRDRIRLCRDCFNLSEAELCPICSDPKRDRGIICVVEDPAKLLAVERTGAFRGLYHVLGGALSPLRDRGPDDLRLRELMDRVRDRSCSEIVLATSPSVEGEATAVYASRLLKPLGLKVTRLAQGLPAGGDLEYTDDLTVRRAFEGRRDFC